MRDQTDDYIDASLARFEQLLTASLETVTRGRARVAASRAEAPAGPNTTPQRPGMRLTQRRASPTSQPRRARDPQWAGTVSCRCERRFHRRPRRERRRALRCELPAVCDLRDAALGARPAPCRLARSVGQRPFQFAPKPVTTSAQRPSLPPQNVTPLAEVRVTIAKARLDPRQPLVLDTRELGRRPGSMRRVQATVPAPADLGAPAWPSVPAGSELALDLRLESVMEGVLVSGTARAVDDRGVRALPEPVASRSQVEFQELFSYPDPGPYGARRQPAGIAGTTTTSCPSSSTI